jgi:chromosome segregation ATPase
MVLETLGTAGGVVASIVGGYVWLVVRPLEKDNENMSKRIDALHEDKKELERRINDLEKNALTRVEIESMRKEIEASVEKFCDRLLTAIDKLSTRVDHAFERVARVESGRGRGEQD